MRIAVTTPTGNVGRHIVAGLVRAGVRPLVLLRDPARLDSPLLDWVDPLAVDQGDEEAVLAATEGCRRPAGGLARAGPRPTIRYQPTRRHDVDRLRDLGNTITTRSSLRARGWLAEWALGAFPSEPIAALMTTQLRLGSPFRHPRNSCHVSNLKRPGARSVGSMVQLRHLPRSPRSRLVRAARWLGIPDIGCR